MSVNCNDLERIFLDGTPEDWAALEQHAATCVHCAEELRAWKSLSMAAAELREEPEAPALWQRIESALAEHQRNEAARRDRWAWLALWRQVSAGWQAALAGAMVLLLVVGGGYLIRHPRTPNPNNPLLKESALEQVERSERDYSKAIDKLAAEARPQLAESNSPLMLSYREKLDVLDSAIEDLRQQAGMNPSNAHLRYQLLAMYQEKQQTLREVLETKR